MSDRLYEAFAYNTSERKYTRTLLYQFMMKLAQMHLMSQGDLVPYASNFSATDHLPECYREQQYGSAFDQWNLVILFDLLHKSDVPKMEVKLKKEFNRYWSATTKRKKQGKNSKKKKKAKRDSSSSSTDLLRLLLLLLED